MSTMLKSIKISIIVLIVFLGMSSCGGSATNNDQGTSFLALGYYQRVDDEWVPQVGSIVPLFVDSATLTQFQIFDLHTVIAAIGLQNRLSKQFIRVTRLDCSYDIQGAPISIPDDSFTFSAVLGSTEAAAEETAGDTDVLGQVAYAEFEIVSPDIMAYLNNNINYLPQLPFRMTVTCEASGITQAGDSMTTNPVSYFIQFADVAECCTGANGEQVGISGGFQEGTGTGGTINYGVSSSSGSASSTAALTGSSL